MLSYLKRIIKKPEEVKPAETPAPAPAPVTSPTAIPEEQIIELPAPPEGNPMFTADAINIFMDNYHVGHRAIWLENEIGDDATLLAIRQLNFWNDTSKKPVYIYLNSPGGSGSDCLAIVDSMNALKAKGVKVYTINVGIAYSAAAIIFAMGSSGCRYAYPSSRLMFHQGRYFGLDVELKAEDLEQYKKELEILNTYMVDNITKSTGMSKKDVKELLSTKDRYLSASEAKKLGIVDKIEVLSV